MRQPNTSNYLVEQSCENEKREKKTVRITTTTTATNYTNLISVIQLITSNLVAYKSIATTTQAIHILYRAQYKRRNSASLFLNVSNLFFVRIFFLHPKFIQIYTTLGITNSIINKTCNPLTTNNTEKKNTFKK